MSQIKVCKECSDNLIDNPPLILNGMVSADPILVAALGVRYVAKRLK